MHNFKELKIWQKGIDLVMDYYKMTNSLPKEEQFNLISQMRRAVVSIPSNIAEGSSRKSQKDFARFLHISLGSGYELETQLIVANRLGYVTDENFNSLENKTKELQRMIYGFSNKISSN